MLPSLALCLFGRGGCVWAAAMLALQAWLVRRLAGTSGAAGLRGAAAQLFVHSRTLELVDAATHGAFCGAKHN